MMNLMNNDPATKPMMQVLGGTALRRPPVWLMRQAGRYLPEYRALRAKVPNFIDFCFDSERAAEVTLQPIRRYGFDASIVFADILLLPHVVGAEVRFVENEGPRLEPLAAPASVDALAWDKAAAGLAPVSDTVARVRAGLPDTTTLIGFAGAPWTVATYMLGGGKGEAGRRDARAWAATHPEPTDALLGYLADATADYLAAQLEAGADVVKLFESWAADLAPPLFERLVIAPTRRCVERLRRTHPNAPIIGFPRGSGIQAVDFAREAGVDALALDMTQASEPMLAALPTTLPLQGALDPAILVAGTDALRAEVARLLHLFAGRPYIFNLGHGIWPQTPPEHVSRLLTLLDELSAAKAAFGETA